MSDEQFKLVHLEGPFENREESNRAVLQHIFRGKIKPGKEKEVWNYLYFSRLEDAREAAAELAEIGFRIEEIDSRTDPAKIMLLVTITIPLTEETINRLTRFLEERARRFHGKYDGWEVEILPEER